MGTVQYMTRLCVPGRAAGSTAPDTRLMSAQHHSYTVHLHLLTRVQIVVSSRRPARPARGSLLSKLAAGKPQPTQQISTLNPSRDLLDSIKISNAAQSPRPGSRCSRALSPPQTFCLAFATLTISRPFNYITYSGAAVASPAKASCCPRSLCLVGAASPKPKISFPNIPTWRPQHAHPTTHNPHPYPHPAAPSPAHPIHPTPPYPAPGQEPTCLSTHSHNGPVSRRAQYNLIAALFCTSPILLALTLTSRVSLCAPCTLTSASPSFRKA